MTVSSNTEKVVKTCNIICSYKSIARLHVRYVVNAKKNAQSRIVLLPQGRNSLVIKRIFTVARTKLESRHFPHFSLLFFSLQRAFE